MNIARVSIFAVLALVGALVGNAWAADPTPPAAQPANSVSSLANLKVTSSSNPARAPSSSATDTTPTASAP